MTCKCLNNDCKSLIEIATGQTVTCPACNFTAHLHPGPAEDAAEFLAAQPTTKTPRFVACNGGFLLGWSYEKVPPILLTSLTGLFEDSLAAQVAMIIQDGLGTAIKMPITLVEKRDGDVAHMLPSTKPPRCCSEAWSDPDKLERCRTIAAAAAAKYIGRYRDDPIFRSMDEPACWAVKERRHLVKPVFVNDRAVALAFSARWIPGDDYDEQSPEEYVRAYFPHYVEQYGVERITEMLCTHARWEESKSRLQEVVDTMSRFAQDHYLLERHERDARFTREVEALYSASLVRPGSEETRKRTRVIVERTASYFMFQYGLWLELEETGLVDGCSHKAVLVGAARNEEAAPLPTPPETGAAADSVPLRDAEVRMLFPAAVTNVPQSEVQAEVFARVLGLLRVGEMSPEVVVLVPITGKSVLMLVNRHIRGNTYLGKQSVSEYALRALGRLQLSLIQEQRHQEALKQVNFILTQVGHELAMATDSLAQKGKLLKLSVNDPNTRVGYLNSMIEELELLGALREKVMIANKLAIGGRLKRPRRDRIENFYQDVVVGKANLLTRHANARGIWIDYKNQIAATPRPFYIDKGFIGQVLLNMLDNAIKYSTIISQPVVISAGFKDITQTSMTLWFTVSNVGVGVPEGEREYIFKAGTQGSNAGSVAKKGSGIGMFVSKQIMKWLGGNLTVESGARAPERTVFRAEVKVDCVKERE